MLSRRPRRREGRRQTKSGPAPRKGPVAPKSGGDRFATALGPSRSLQPLLPFICALQAFFASVVDIPELSDFSLAMQSFIDCLLAIRVVSR